MLKKCLLSIFLICVVLCSGFSQKRYLQEVFNSVTVAQIVYGSNYSFLTGAPTLVNLNCDVYTPNGDTETKRPLILYFHSGNFLPIQVNQSVSGTKVDSTVVTMCTRLAKMGYVVVSVDYRLGWNPASPSEDTRKSTLIQAAYRGVQDVRSAVRYFKLNESTFKIDTSKVIIWGQGTGGYLSLNTGALDKYDEIINTTNPENKFYDVNGFPMVTEAVNGDVDGTKYAIVNGDDTICKPNNVGPTGNVQLVVNMGGALGDISWVDKNTPPIISFQTINDPFAPYKDAILFVPGATPQPVVQVQGAYVVQEKMKALDLNNAFAQYHFIDPLSTYASSINNGFEGLFPFFKAEAEKNDSSPWDFWDKATNPNNQIGLFFNPNMSKEKAVKYMDTVVNYVAPRACLVLNLNCDLDGIIGNKKISIADAGLKFYPNPMSQELNISTTIKTIKSIEFLDASGRSVKVAVVNSNQFKMLNENLKAGIYFAKVNFENEVTSFKFIVQ